MRGKLPAIAKNISNEIDEHVIRQTLRSYNFGNEEVWYACLEACLLPLDPAPDFGSFAVCEWRGQF
jgi:hypothetical protein